MQTFVTKINEGLHVIAVENKGQLKTKFRLTNPYIKIAKLQDREFPDSKDLSYHNYLSEICFRKGGYREFNFTLQNGAKSNIRTDEVLVP